MLGFDIARNKQLNRPKRCILIYLFKIPSTGLFFCETEDSKILDRVVGPY